MIIGPLIELCKERSWVISNMHTIYDKGHSNLLDFVLLLDKNLRGRVLDMHVFRGATDRSDHYLVEQ